ncbi:30667_t:CDS:1, partial [Gigaspora margarita]
MNVESKVLIERIIDMHAVCALNTLIVSSDLKTNPDATYDIRK